MKSMLEEHREYLSFLNSLGAHTLKAVTPCCSFNYEARAPHEPGVVWTSCSRCPACGELLHREVYHNELVLKKYLGG